MITNQVNLINPENIIQQVLEKSILIFICHLIMVDSPPPEVHPLQKTRNFSTITQTITFHKTYKDFEDVFWIKNTGHLPLNKDQNYAINFIDGKQPYYGLIYILSENKLSIFWAYIGKNMTNKFIKLSKSLSDALIFFVPKPNKGLRWYVDYRDLNNITIKDWYSFFLVGKSLDRLGQAKKFTKLDFTDSYYWIRIKKSEKLKTAFWIWYSHYEYCVMPFSLANAPATF